MFSALSSPFYEQASCNIHSLPPAWATPDLQLTNPVVEGENATFSISPVDKTCYWRLNQEKLGDRFKQVDVMWVQQADGISKASNWTATREDNGSVFMASCGSLTTNNVTLIVNREFPPLSIYRSSPVSSLTCGLLISLSQLALSVSVSIFSTAQFSISTDAGGRH